MTKLVHTEVFPTNSLEAVRKTYTVAGLPLSTAIVYVLLFAVAFWFYTASWVTAPILVSDSPTYLSTAQRLLNFQISELRTPGYPLLLVLVGSAQSPNRVLFFVSLLLHFASVWLLASLLYLACLNEMTLSLFGLVLLLPPYVEFAAYVLSENLAEFMLVAGFVTFVFWLFSGKAIWITMSALAVGYAALTRPTYQFLALAMAGYLVIARFLFCRFHRNGRELIKGSLILFCGSLVLVGGYAYLNYRSFGYFGVSSNLGLVVSTKTWRSIERLPDEYASIKAALIRARNAQLVEELDGSRAVWVALPDLTKLTGLEDKQLSDYMLKINLLLIQKAPLSSLHEVVSAFASYWFPSSTMLANFGSRALQFLWAALHFLLLGAFGFNLIVLLGASSYIWKAKQFANGRRNVPASEMRLVQLQALVYGLAATIVMYTAGISCLVEVGDPRYRVPTDSLIVFMLFLGIHLWRRLIDLSRIESGGFPPNLA